jgi:hypothetical protein
VANVAEEHLILGVEERGLQIEKSRWLTENPGIKIVETIIQQEPPSLLARIGGKHIPRLSMLVRYHSEAPLSPSAPSEENAGNDRPDGKGNQSAHQDLLTGESSVDVENMAQQGRGQNRGD